MQIITRLSRIVVPMKTIRRGPSFLNYNPTMFKAVYPFSSAGYETLMSQISSTTTAQEVLDLWRTNKTQFKNEHVIQSLRMLGRNSKFLGQDLQQNDDYKAAYAQIQQRLEGVVGEISEFDLIDVLFFLRKARQNKLQGLLNNESYNLVFKRINDYVSQRSYSFRNLVNIYYDMAMLGRNTEFLIEQLTKTIKTEQSQVTPFIAVQLLQAASKRTKNASIKEWIMIDGLIRQLNNLLEDFDLDQKSSLFKYISVLEINYHFPSYKIPPVLYTIRTQILNKLESLSEFGVLNVISGYQSLPSLFPLDLLNEIKDMVNVTLETNPNNLKHAFLLDFTEIATQIQRRKFDEKKLTIISSEIAKRLNSAEIHNTQGNVDKIARIYAKLSKSSELIDSIHNTVTKIIGEFQNTQKAYTIPLYALEFLVLAKRDISEIISQIQSVQIDRLSPNAKLRLLGILMSQNNESYSQLQIAITQNLLDRSDSSPDSAILAQETLLLDNRQQFKELNGKFIQKLHESLTYENFSKHIKAIYLSIQDQDTRLFWTEWLKNIEIQKFNLYKFMEEFDLEPQSYCPDNIRFFLDVLSSKPEELNISRLLCVFQNNNKLTNDIARNDIFAKRIFELIRVTKELRPNEVRLLDVLQLIMRFESCLIRSEQYSLILKKCYDLNRVVREGIENQQLDAPYLTYMMKYKCLSETEALILSDRLQRTNDVFFKGKLLALAQQADGGEKLNDLIVELAKDFAQRLSSEKLSVQLIAIPALLCFKPQIYEQYSAQILQVLRDNATKISGRLFGQMVQSIPRKWIQQVEERQLILPILKELIDQYPIQSTGNFADLLTIMENFVNLQVKNTILFNNFLNDVGKVFNNMTVEQRIRTLKIFSQSQIKQLDFFQKSLEKINEQPKNFRFHVGEISQILFRVGINDEISREQYFKFVENFPDKQNGDLVSILQLLCIMTSDKNLINQYVNKLKEGRIQSTFKHNAVVQVTEFVDRKIGKEQGNKVRNLLIENDYDKAFRSSLGSNQKFPKTQLVNQLLKAMNVEHQNQAVVEGLIADIYIPSQKIIISLIKPSSYNHDKQTVAGQALMKKLILETISGHTVIQFSQKDLEISARSSIDKVNYLITKGIKSNNTGNYDLSDIKESEGFKNQKFLKREQSNNSSDDEEAEAKQR